MKFNTTHKGHRFGKASLLIPAIASLFALTACDNDDLDQQNGDDMTVKIASAYIASDAHTRVNTLEDGTKFEEGDYIYLTNLSRANAHEGWYQFDGTSWKQFDGNVIYAAGLNDFKAEYGKPTLKADQNSGSSILGTNFDVSDYMIATANDVPYGEPVVLNFERQRAKVTVNTTLSEAFAAGTTIDTLFFFTNEAAPLRISPYKQSDSKYTAILYPGTYEEGATFISVTVGDVEMTVPVNSTLTSGNGLEAGKHYIFNLKVGKETIAVNNLEVVPWTGNTIEDGQTEPRLGTIDGKDIYTGMELVNAIKEKIAAGATEVEIENVLYNSSGYGNKYFELLLDRHLEAGAFIPQYSYVDDITYTALFMTDPFEALNKGNEFYLLGDWTVSATESESFTGGGYIRLFDHTLDLGHNKLNITSDRLSIYGSNINEEYEQTHAFGNIYAKSGIEIGSEAAFDANGVNIVGSINNNGSLSCSDLAITGNIVNTGSLTLGSETRINSSEEYDILTSGPIFVWYTNNGKPFRVAVPSDVLANGDFQLSLYTWDESYYGDYNKYVTSAVEGYKVTLKSDGYLYMVAE